MMSKQGAVQSVVMWGLLLGPAMTCFAQSDAPIQPERAQEVRPATEERTIYEQPVQRERLAQRTVVQERVVERRREGDGALVRGFLRVPCPGLTGVDRERIFVRSVEGAPDPALISRHPPRSFKQNWNRTPAINRLSSLRNALTS